MLIFVSYYGLLGILGILRLAESRIALDQVLEVWELLLFHETLIRRLTAAESDVYKLYRLSLFQKDPFHQ